MTQELLLLTAPPASGKTFWIQSLITQLGEQSILVVSPLRALADECRSNWGDRVSVMTPEEWLVKKIFKQVVIFDEFHLYFYWGDSFRPTMWEVFYELAAEAELSILLTATLSDSMKSELKLFINHFDRMLWVDRGNQVLKNNPDKYLLLPDLNFLKDFMMINKHQGTAIIFCAYREDVFYWGKLLTQKGFKAWTCVGGEAAEFSKKVQSESPPDFIVATTVLSHGVNLPQVSTIYFLYEVKNIDFWIQMVARGGRKGEKFKVYALENPHGIKWDKWTNHLAILPLRFKIKYHKSKRQFSQWFLKD